MIKREGSGYRLHSRTTGKPLGPVRKSKAEAMKKDEKRVQFFKNLKSSKGGPGSLKSKIHNKDLLNK